MFTLCFPKCCVQLRQFISLTKNILYEFQNIEIVANKVVIGHSDRRKRRLQLCLVGVETVRYRGAQLLCSLADGKKGRCLDLGE